MAHIDFLYKINIMYGGQQICSPENRTDGRNRFIAGGPASCDANGFYVQSTLNVRWQHICGAGSRINVKHSFTVCGPGGCEAHVFYVRSTFHVRGSTFAAQRAGLI